MRLKTYRAPDLAGALAMARRELGPQALVLATNEIPGRLGLSQVEVTVAADRAPVEPTDPRLERIAGEVRASREGRPGPHPLDANPAPGATPPATPVDGPAARVIREAVRTLVETGLSEDLARRFARIATSDLPFGGDPARIAAATERGVGALLSFTPAPPAGRVVFVVGPPGAGKTTTAAKLAARVGLGAGRPVVFGAADAERVGAAEQARIFSEYIGARLRTIDTPGDLGMAMHEAGERGSVVVDTAGVGESDRGRLRSLWGLRRSVPDAEVALLIPAGMHHEEARRVLERFAIVRPTCAAFSRVDDGQRVGDLVTALAEFELPLSFLTNGHRVPDDLQDATPRGLAALMLRHGDRLRRTARQETH